MKWIERKTELNCLCVMYVSVGNILVKLLIEYYMWWGMIASSLQILHFPRDQWWSVTCHILVEYVQLHTFVHWFIQWRFIWINDSCYSLMNGYISTYGMCSFYWNIEFHKEYAAFRYNVLRNIVVFFRSVVLHYVFRSCKLDVS